ncbi:hypothetical protein MHU86_3186 [Fragilaria crotonensis]|nr:hypothetical protein MHU86_3186 [Fragilaria crotonensis]
MEEWGGWSSEGIKQFNFLRALVKADREADKNCEDEPKRMEKLLMDFCQTKVGIKDTQDDENQDGAGDGANNNAAARAKDKQWRMLRQNGTLMTTRSLFYCHPLKNAVERLSCEHYLLYQK